MMDRIRGILFDLGDTLLDFAPVDIRVMFEAGARLAYEYLQGLGQPVPSFAKFHRKQLWAIRWSYLKSRVTRREFNSLELIGRVGKSMGHDLTDEQMAHLAWLWYEPLSRCASVEAGLGDLLHAFRDAGLTLGLVSNTFVPAEVLDKHLRQEGLLEFFPVRVYSCEVRYRKPSPEVFRIALERTGLEPSQALFVGDSLQADIDGANRAGLVSVLKDPKGRHDNTRIKPAYRIRRLTELPAIIDRHNQGD